MVKNLIAFITFFILTSINSYSEVRLSSQVNKAKATTSDTIIFSIELIKPEKSIIEIPNIGNQIAGLRIVDFGSDKPVTENGETKLRNWFNLEADISGTYILPAIKIDYNDINGTQKSIKSSEIFLDVESPYSNDKKDPKTTPKDIRDIKDIIQLKSYFLILAIFTIVILILLSTAIYFFLKKRKKEKLIKKIPAHITALKDLKKLSNEIHSDYKYFSFKLSEIIRIYFEEIFYFPATDRTTFEIKRSISTLNHLEKVNKDIFLKILEKTDLIKFTDTTLNELESKNILTDSKLFIESTMPKEDLIEDEESVI